MYIRSLNWTKFGSFGTKLISVFRLKRFDRLHESILDKHTTSSLPVKYDDLIFP